MNSRHILQTLGAFLLALLIAAPLAAQQREPAIAVPSAKMEAIASSGIMRNPNGSDDIVARAIYVKLRKGHAGANPPATVRALASGAGLRTASATHLAFTQIPLEKDLAARIQSMPSAQRALVAEAEEDMSRIVEVHYTSNMLPADAARLMARLPQVEYAEPISIPYALGDPAGMPAGTNDPKLDDQFHLAQARIREAWDVWKGDTNMVIAIVDAGIDMFHEDLAPNIKENPGEVGTDAQGNDKRTNRRDDDGNGVPDDWRGANLTAFDDGSAPGNTKGSTHGTQVAGLSSAATNNGIGIAGSGYNCKFFPIKTALASGGSLIRAYEGINYAARRGFKVINCSFGSDDYQQVLQDVINNLVKAYDCAILAGAGNGVLYAPFYPAGYKNVIGVGAIDRDNGFRTTWGEQVAVSAPAHYSIDDNNIYTPLGPATSYATPVASGVVGLIRSKFPSLKAAQALAHLRLTSDVLPSEGPDKYRLTGYGRINAHRAVTTDPFSHPAIFVDTLWMIDERGEPMERATVGKVARLKIRLRNILGPANNVRLRITTYNSDSAIVSVKDTLLALSSIGTNEVKVLDGSIPFQVKLPNSNHLRLRIDVTADGNYIDYHYEKVLFYLPYITVRTPNITVSLTDRGRIGYEDNPDNLIGEGFKYDNISFLYESGLIIASDPVRVLNNIRTVGDNPPQADFGPVEFPSSANNYTLTLNDAPAGDRRIGLEIRMRMFTADTVPGGVGLEVRVKNTTQAPIDSLRIGMFADWDLDNSDIEQSIDYVARPNTNVPFYGLVTGPSGYFLTHGVAAPAQLPIFFAIRNDSLPMRIYEGFTPDKKWYTVSNGIGQRRAVASDSSDVSLVIGKRVAGLRPGAEDTTIFVIGISTIAEEAVDFMRALAPKRIDSSASVDRDVMAGHGMLGAIQPNPFGGVTAINILRAERDAKLHVYDALGRLVADLTDQLARSGAPATIHFDGSRLPNGIYQVQILSSRGSETRQIVVLH